MTPRSPLLLALLTAGCANETEPLDDAAFDSAAEPSPAWRSSCEGRIEDFKYASNYRYPASEHSALYPDPASFTAATGDDTLVVEGPKGDRIDGVLVLQSRWCGEGSGLEGTCNIVGFKGKLFGYDVTPTDSALDVRDDFWCYDEDVPLWFAGFVDLGVQEKTLFLYGEQADVAEPETDPVANPNAVVYGLDVRIWEVSETCTLDTMPCGQDAPLATGTMMRGDRPRWNQGS